MGELRFSFLTLLLASLLPGNGTVSALSGCQTLSCNLKIRMILISLLFVLSIILVVVTFFVLTTAD